MDWHCSSLLTEEAFIELHPAKYFTTNKALAADIPQEYLVKAAHIMLVPSPKSHQTDKQLHQLPTPTITPVEVSMAFGPTNMYKGRTPSDLVGHRSKVYVAWVSEQDSTNSTLSGIFQNWKPYQQAIIK
eukprot:1109726-Ditylum_brightwellii.AAC.1